MSTAGKVQIKMIQYSIWILVSVYEKEPQCCFISSTSQ